MSRQRFHFPHRADIVYGMLSILMFLLAAGGIWKSGIPSLPPQTNIALVWVTVAMVLSVAWKKIDIKGGIAGIAIGMAIFLGSGFVGLGLLATFFVLGTLASRWKYDWKLDQGLAEANRGVRSAIHAWSNGGVAALCGLFAWVLPDWAPVFQVMLAASLAAATGDTLSSELGNVYGRRYVDILTWKSANRGHDGVISLVGTFIGFLGSFLVAGIYGVSANSLIGFSIVVGAGLAGNLADSVLGASLQRKGWLDNHAVNFLNTLLAAALAGVLFRLGLG